MNKIHFVDSQQPPSAGPLQPFNILVNLSSYRRLLTVEEVAAILGRSPCTIYRWARKHDIPNVMIGGSRMFDPSELVLWLKKKDPQLAVAARYFDVKAA